MTEPVIALRLLAPQIAVALTGAVVLLADLIWPGHGDERPSSHAWLAYLGVGGLTLSALLIAVQTGSGAPSSWGPLVIDPLTVYFELIFLGIAVAVLLLSVDSFPEMSPAPAEFYTLVIWCTLGNMLVAPAGELFTLFVCLQLTSLPLIVLIGYGKRDPLSGEAALKYLLVVLVSTAIFLYGLSLVFGVFGTSQMSEIGAALASQPLPAMGAIGLAMMLAGFGFKVAAVPFQFWVPDVYQGAPAPVTAFIAVGSKLAGFALVLRFIVTGLNANPDMHLVFAVLAVLSMLVGNLGALQQTNIKRLLAYSGIAQAGYIMLGLAALSATGISSLLFYLAAYGIASLLSFGVVVAFSRATGSENVSDLAGLARRSPLAAFSLTAALMSLAGLPLTAGFMAKFYVFLSAAQAGLLWLVVIAVLNAVLAFFYYLSIVWAIYVDESTDTPISLSSRHRAVMVVCTTAILAIGVFPQPLLGAADHVSRALFGS